MAMSKTEAEGEPGLLKAPEGSHGALDPGVETTLCRNGGSEFTEHERGREAPKNGSRMSSRRARPYPPNPMMSSRS